MMEVFHRFFFIRFLKVVLAQDNVVRFVRCHNQDIQSVSYVVVIFRFMVAKFVDKGTDTAATLSGNATSNYFTQYVADLSTPMQLTAVEFRLQQHSSSIIPLLAHSGVARICCEEK